MKVLQINCVYKKGSTGKITHDIHTELLKRNIESVVCYGRGEVIKEQRVYKICPEWYAKLNKAVSMFTGIMYGGCYFSTRKLIRIIEKEKSDIVHLQCINGYFVNIYKLVEWLKANHIKTVLTLHAEFMYTGGCGYSINCNQWSSTQGCQKCPRWRIETKSLFFDRTKTMWKRMKKAFTGFDEGIVITSVSPWLMERAARSPVLLGKEHRVIFNGLDTDVFHHYETDELKKSLNLGEEKIVFHVTPQFNLNPQHIKGGYYVNELAKKFEGKKIKFLVAGSYPKDIKVSNNIILLGKIADQRKLAKLYSMADVTLLTSKRETFSMVTAESLCCGTPVVGFKAGGPEQIAIKEYSMFYDFGDIISLKNGIRFYLSKKKDEKISQIAIKKYSIDKMVNDYLTCYSKIRK